MCPDHKRGAGTLNQGTNFKSRRRDTMRTALENLTKDITSNPALSNRFYTMWMAGPLRIEGLEVFVRNYGAFVKAFPDALTALILETQDTDAKLEHVKTLYSEMGYGNPEKLHSVLFDNFFNELSHKMGYDSRLDRSRLEKEVPLLPTTSEFIAKEQELYSSKNPRIGVGAQLAQEWQAYTMLRQLYDGARNYLSLWSNPDEFHEACEYFYVHIGAAEKEHKEESINAAVRYSNSDSDFREINQGYNGLLGIFADFWDGVYNAIAAGDA
jgi:pyrroloquinoline quinone (PQQ) biosynthesis protein C